MKILPIVCLTAAVALPHAALGQTVKEVTTRGAILTAGDNKLEASFTPDGRFTLAMVVDEGKWRIDEDKLCSTSDLTLMEQCIAYPANKKSGDVFELDASSGRVTVRIK